MKKVIVLSTLLFTLGSATYAQDMILPENVVEPESISNTDRQTIDESELPSSVVRALDEGSYEGMDITEAFVLQGDALKHAAAERTDLVPRVLYELQLWSGNQFATVYFTEQGEVYEADRSV